MAILGFHGEKHRMALALFGGSVGAAAELAVPTPPPQVSQSLAPAKARPRLSQFLDSLDQRVKCGHFRARLNFCVHLWQIKSVTFPLGIDDNMVVPIVSCIIIQNTVDAIAAGHIF